MKKKFRVFSIRAGMDMPFFLLIMVILCIGLVMLFSASYANAYYVYGDSYYFIRIRRCLRCWASSLCF